MGDPVDIAGLQALVAELRADERLTRAERTLANARKALSGMPVFNRTRAWRVFMHEWTRWYNINAIDEAGAEFSKRALLLAMKGSAAEITSLVGPGTAVWINHVHFQDQAGPPFVQGYATALKELFEPSAESDLAKTNFCVAKQGTTEDISGFVAHKEALFKSAYGEKGPVDIYIDECITAMHSRVVKRIVKRARPWTMEALRNEAINAVADERAALAAGYGESTSYAGLAATTTTGLTQQQEPMDITAMEVMKVEAYTGRCHTCDKPGHFARNCPKKKNSPKKGGKANKAKVKCDLSTSAVDAMFERCMARQVNSTGSAAPKVHKKFSNKKASSKKPQHHRTNKGSEAMLE